MKRPRPRGQTGAPKPPGRGRRAERTVRGSAESQAPTATDRGLLYVVATPIGNLNDITMRGVEVLRSVNLIACEDTRTSRVLLQRWQVSTELMSLHRFSERRKTEAVVARLEAGQTVALITDAGTPAISDPGNRLVSAVRAAGYAVVPIPGASAITAALSVSGMDCSSFVYLGFVPKKLEQRGRFFRGLREESGTAVFFETPARIVSTLDIAAPILRDRPMVLFRELTKLHEEALVGTAQRLLEILAGRNAVKGEIVVVVQGAGPSAAGDQPSLDNAVRVLMDEGLRGKELAQEAKRRYGLSATAVYGRFLEMKEVEETNEGPD